MTMSATRERYASLECVQIDGGPNPDALVVALHGYGAPGDDLVPVASEWTRVLGDAARRVRFIFPTATLSLDALGMPGGRAWWQLNMARLMAAVETKDFTELRTHEPPGLTEAREAIVEGLDEMLSATGCDQRRLVLGGFSQGAMLAMDVALRGLANPPAVLFQYSGTLICEAAWTAAADRLADTETIQSHGSMDAILPFEGAEALYGLLKVSGVPVQFFPFEGPHTLTMKAVDETAAAIGRMLDRNGDTPQKPDA